MALGRGFPRRLENIWDTKIAESTKTRNYDEGLEDNCDKCEMLATRKVRMEN